MTTCSQCGYTSTPGALFCGGCGTRLPQDTDASTDPWIARTLDNRYVVEAKLGEGGMGSVYRARDTRLPRQLAIKMLSPDLLSHPTARQRMMQEAHALARVEHPNVVRVFDVFTHEYELFIVMELVTGGDLSRLIRQPGMPETEAARLIDGMLAGLGAIHGAGLVHRDLKPENVLLTETGVPKITDLGVARDTQAQQRTQLGARLGTPAYMSPEQAQGLVVDHRSDVYAMGLILFELLTGQRPFKGQSELELLAARVQSAPDLAAMAERGVSLQRQSVVARALARDLAYRFGSAEEMRSALGGSTATPPPPQTVSPPPPTPRQATPPPVIQADDPLSFARGSLSKGAPRLQVVRALMERFALPIGEAGQIAEEASKL